VDEMHNRAKSLIVTAEAARERIISKLLPLQSNRNRLTLDYWNDEYPGYPVADWQYEVANGDTRLGYWEWAEAREEE